MHSRVGEEEESERQDDSPKRPAPDPGSWLRWALGASPRLHCQGREVRAPPQAPIWEHLLESGSKCILLGPLLSPRWSGGEDHLQVEEKPEPLDRAAREFQCPGAMLTSALSGQC